jgi:hypothetical protein
MHFKPIFTLLAASFAAGDAAGEIVDSTAAGFTIRHSADIGAPRAQVYRAAVSGIGEWWSDNRTVSGNASNLYIDPAPQGCFCERLGPGSGVVHLTVTFVNPTVMLRLTGGLGPLGLLGASGNMVWEFEDNDSGTTVTWSYTVGGYSPGGLDALAPDVDRVLIEQLNRLKAFLENGDSG